MPSPGLVAVVAELGSAVSDAEFDDWYENEHVPLRIFIPTFQSWSRWTAIDSQKPSILALYDLADCDALDQPLYTTLASTRSAREADILKRLDLVDRRIYDKLDVPVPPRAGAAYDIRKPGPYLVAVMMDVPGEHEADFSKWYDEEHTALLSKIPQWARTTRYVLREGSTPGVLAARAPKYLALHEYTTADMADTPEFQHAISTEWTKKVFAYATVFERRVFKLVRTWERA